MRKKYAGALLKSGKIKGSMRYVASAQKADRVKTLMKQAAEKASHGKVIQSGEVSRDDLIEALVGALMEKDKCDDKDDKKENPFAKFKKKKKKDDEEDDD